MGPFGGRNSPQRYGVLDHRRTDRRPPRRGRTGDPGKTYPVVAVTAVLGLLLVIGQLIRTAEWRLGGLGAVAGAAVDPAAGRRGGGRTARGERRDHSACPRPPLRRLRLRSAPAATRSARGGRPQDLPRPPATPAVSRRRLPAGACGSPTTAGDPQPASPAWGSSSRCSGSRPTHPAAGGGLRAPARPEPSGLYLSCDGNFAPGPDDSQGRLSP